MKNLLRAGAMALALSSLGGCAALQNLENAVSTLGGQTVTPEAVIVAGNAFDGVEATATNYLKLPPCAAGGPTICRTQAGVNAIVPAIRAGRSARSQLEADIAANPGQPVSITPYNVLTASISSLNSALAQYNAGQ